MRHGFAAIAGVLVMTAVLGSLLFVAAFLAIGESQAGLDLLRAERTLALAEGCAEDALLSAKGDENYDGGAVTHPEGTCDIAVGKNGLEWTLSVSASRDGFTRNLEVVFDRVPILGTVVLHRWQEIL